MSKDKKILLLFPPQWTPISPHFAMASLMGQLKNNGYSAHSLDLNIEFYNHILTSDYLNFIIDKIKKDYVELFQQIRGIYSKNKKEEDYTLEQKCDIYKFSKIKKFIEKNDTQTRLLPSLIEMAKGVLRSEDKFFTPNYLIRALNNIDKSLDLISLAYSPTHLEFDSCYNPFMKFNFESIKHFVFDKKSNVFWDYLKAKADEIKTQNYSLCAISLNSSSQLIAGLTLAYLLKKNTKAHVNIGGNFFGRIKEDIIKRPEFNIFCDSISIEEGEGPILELAKFINKEIKIEKVSNLIYFDNSKSYETFQMIPVRLNKMENVNLDDYDLKKYFTPIITMPYQTSRGCYWGKCSFCDQDFGQEFNVKNIDKVIIEMRELKEKYNITHYEFIDESVSPTYLSEFSKKLLETDINPKFFCDARLESAFCEEIFEHASKAGLKMVMWGLESGSKKIMESINKGIDLDKRFDILKAANKYGIWNFAFIFFGYPLETPDDARETIDMIINNHEVINSYGRSVFTMGRHAKIADEPEKYGITKIYEAEYEFSPNIEFECIGMNKTEVNKIVEECKAKCFQYYNNPLWMYLRYREWLFLYIDKYGLDWVKNYSVKL